MVIAGGRGNGCLNVRNPVVRLLKALEKFLYRRAERIIVLRPQMREYISARGVRWDRIVWLPNGEERKSMGRRGRAYVEEHHDIRKLAGRLEHVLLRTHCVQG